MWRSVKGVDLDRTTVAATKGILMRFANLFQCGLFAILTLGVGLIANLGLLAQSESPRGGIGVRLGKEGENVVVEGILPNSTAAKSKAINVGDRIVTVDDKDGKPVKVFSYNFSHAVSLIGGQIGTPARLTIIPAGKDESQMKVVSIVRGDLKPILDALSKEPPVKENPVTLKIGDLAPPLKATRWLQGEEVKTLEPGKIYVVEFWATWCWPCIGSVPLLSEIQATYQDKGVTVIGYSAKDPNNTEAQVTKFVKKREPHLKYTVAYSDDRDTYDAWVTAAGKNGAGWLFVVDGTGKIVCIGTPVHLHLVLPKLIDGTWKGDKDSANLDEIDKEVTKIFQVLGGADTQTSLKALQEFDAKHPELSKLPYFLGPRLKLLIQAGKDAEARKLAEENVARALKQHDPYALREVSRTITAEKATADKELLMWALQAARAELKVVGENDANALMNLADVFLAMGDKDQAKEFGHKAIEAADLPGLRHFYEQRVKAFDEARKR